MNSQYLYRPERAAREFGFDGIVLADAHPRYSMPIRYEAEHPVFLLSLRLKLRQTYVRSSGGDVSCPTVDGICNRDVIVATGETLDRRSGCSAYRVGSLVICEDMRG